MAVCVPAFFIAMKFLFLLFKRTPRSTLNSVTLDRAADSPVAPANSQSKRYLGHTAFRRTTFRHRTTAVVGGVLACLLIPIVIVQSKNYRRDLSMAHEQFPGAPNYSARDRVLVLSPHCDDETLGAGGAIVQARRAGAQVKVVFFTNGDGSRSTQIAENAKHLRRFSFQELATMRQSESIAAVAELGVAAEDVIFLGYPDGGLRAMWEKHWQRTNYRSPYTKAMRSPYPNSFTRAAPYRGSQLLADLEKILVDFKPTTLLTTHPADTHGDHWAAYAYTRAALEKLRMASADATSGSISTSNAGEWPQQVQLLTFLVHHGIWPVPHGYHPEARLAPPAQMRNCGTQWMDSALDASAQAQKKAALERYVSQLIFTPHYLRAFLRRNEIFGTVPPKVATMQQDTALLRDESSDSLWHKLWPAADIRALWLRLLPAGWSLRLETAGHPVVRFQYEVTIHVLKATETRALTCKVLWRNGAWVALLADGVLPPQSLPVKLRADGFEIEVPSHVPGFAVPGSDASGSSPSGVGSVVPTRTLLMSAAVLRGSSRLDQTETATWRLDSP
ncbi:MAG: hypothetical protein JWN98_509 [Abditibacteriota bacterium]|nr:hypothetical protein [Abditibacteriota bacterium]